MFCIYEAGSKWVAEYVDKGKLKVTAYGKTPMTAVESLFTMIGSDDDEAGVVAEVDGTKPLLPSDTCKPPNCT